MHNRFLEHLEECASSGGYELKRTCATFNLAKTPNAKGVLPGAVYGIAGIFDDIEAQVLEAEAQVKGSLRTPLRSIQKIEIGGAALLPLYWGRDAAVGFRLYRHLLDKSPKSGCLGGRFYTALAEKDLLVASVPVNDFIGFEKYIEKMYPSMLFNVKERTINNFRSTLTSA